MSALIPPTITTTCYDENTCHCFKQVFSEPNLTFTVKRKLCMDVGYGYNYRGLITIYEVLIKVKAKKLKLCFIRVKGRGN
jgi:hypothetical protein